LYLGANWFKVLKYKTDRRSTYAKGSKSSQLTLQLTLFSGNRRPSKYRRSTRYPRVELPNRSVETLFLYSMVNFFCNQTPRERAGYYFAHPTPKSTRLKEKSKNGTSGRRHIWTKLLEPFEQLLFDNIET